MDISVYYDYFEDKLCPIWMLINFDSDKINWNENVIYIPVHTPFKRKIVEDFLEMELSLTITSVDLVVNEGMSEYFGINISTVKKRINKMRGEKYAEFFRLDDIEQFVIQICDVEEVMSMSMNSVYGWRQ